MKRTATTRRNHEIEQVLANANTLLVACIRDDSSLDDYKETRALISELKDIRHLMQNDLAYDPTARVHATEKRIVERRAFTQPTDR